MRRVAVAVVALAFALAACGAGQDPGVTPSDDGSQVPRTTSNTLPPCPASGPDASTPAGCLDPQGKVQQPS